MLRVIIQHTTAWSLNIVIYPYLDPNNNRNLSKINWIAYRYTRD